jgi:hypothetical protein
MTGKIVYVVHRCVPPRILKRYGKGTLWRCDTCSKEWKVITIWGERTWRTADYYLAMEMYRGHKGWGRKPPAPSWSEDRQRMV